MPEHVPDSVHSTRLLRRFFAQRVESAATPSNTPGEEAQVVRHLSERALARAALRMAVHTPSSDSGTASDWKASLMAAALTELHAHK